MSAGASVELTGSESSGYLSVLYNGTAGWAYGDYLDLGGGSSDPPPPSGNAGSETVTTYLNLRDGPSTSNGVLLVIPTGATVTLTGDSSDGYLGVTYNGVSGWAYGSYITSGGGNSSSGGGNATVIDGALNLRSGPGTDYSVLLVMPDAAVVSLDGGNENGFYEVTYNGTSGWAYSAYLQ